MANWLTGKCLGFDLESTGTSVDDDRIVTACAAIVGPAGEVEFQRDWLVAPEIEISPGASEKNGLTTEYAREHGEPPEVAVKEIANAIRYAVHSNMPIVAYNAVFDLSMLSAECVRYGLGTLEEFCGRPIAPVIDPLCIDKATDRYRPGKRQLSVTCEYFGVVLENAHTAAADAIAAVQVAHKLAERCRLDADALRGLYADRKYPNNLVRAFQSLGRMSVAELHATQVVWYREQSESLADYWRQQANELRHTATKARDAGNDSARAQAEQDLADLEQRIDGMRFEWPIAEFKGASS